MSLLSVAAVQGAPVVVQPTLAESQDTFVYRFVPGMNCDGPGWNRLMAIGKTVSGHDAESLIRFSLSGVTLAPGETATLNLYVIDTTAAGFGVSPSEAAPVVAQLFPASSDWQAGTVSWSSKPGTGTLTDTNTITGINRWVQFDVTDLVQGWIDQPETNFGFVLAQESIVTNGGSVMGVFEASAGTNRPFLQVVPEPASMALLAAGLFLMARRTRG